MKTRIAINGFGRIGRSFFRLAIQDPSLEIVAVNDLADLHTLAHLLKYDSIHGRFAEPLVVEENGLRIGNNSILFFSETNPEALPWNLLDIDVVVESTGKYLTKDLAELHVLSGAKKVLLSAPPIGEDIKTIVMGVNEKLIEPDDRILSNASCTTNNAAPMLQILDEYFGVDYAYVTTVHSYTGDQRLHDSPHKDLRRARAAAVSIIPTTTGAAKAITRVFPHLQGKLGGCGMRVPVPNGSLSDISCTIRTDTTIEEVNRIFKRASLTKYSGILEYTDDPIVSIDIVNNPHSCIFDAGLTSVLGRMVKVVGWYDNEWGYSNRLIDLIHYWIRLGPPGFPN
ncbi:MAG: type I glyceraldehyde-3-phosphate dehydrogenase [Bacteroidia bacterium]|nr:type I glyceraldehyde-3-phosphate dehydrogenase [Bacteroidia bacterium]